MGEPLVFIDLKALYQCMLSCSAEEISQKDFHSLNSIDAITKEFEDDENLLEALKKYQLVPEEITDPCFQIYFLRDSRGEKKICTTDPRYKEDDLFFNPTALMDLIASYSKEEGSYLISQITWSLRNLFGRCLTSEEVSIDALLARCRGYIYGSGDTVDPEKLRKLAMVVSKYHSKVHCGKRVVNLSLQKTWAEEY